MSDIALLALLVPLAAFIAVGLWITVSLLVEDAIGREIGK